MALEIETRRVDPDILVVEFAGKITLGQESQRIEPLIKDLLSKGEKKFIFELARVEQIDSTGILIMVSCLTTVNRAGGGLRLAGISQGLHRLFRITRLDTVLSFYPTVAAACENFSVGPP